jgi:hypothetical protein
MPWACLVVEDIAAFQGAVERQGLGLVLDPEWSADADRWSYGKVSHVFASNASNGAISSEAN